MLRKSIFLIVLLVLITGLASAQTIIPGGNVSGTWTLAGSPYLIQGEITIPTNQTLLIEPGVKVDFQGYYKFIVNGTLEAVGTSTDSIWVTATDTIFGWHGIRFIHATGTSYLTYCVIQYGRATGTSTPDCCGGGLRIDNSQLVISHCLLSHNIASSDGGALDADSSNINLSDCIISQNTAGESGGGLHFLRGNPVVSNCTVSDNSASGNGGGIDVETTGSSTFLSASNCVISQNTAGESGGGLHFWHGNPVLSNCTISDNSASGNGGGIGADGAGSTTTISASNCVFDNNHADGDGGAIYRTMSMDLYNCQFTNNSANGDGGAIYKYTGLAYFARCIFTGNYSGDDGGAIFINDDWGMTYPYTSLINCVISANSAEGQGGGLYTYLISDMEGTTISFNTAGQAGGGIFMNSSFSIIFSSANRCNIYFNQAPTGNDLYTTYPMDVIVDTFTVFNPTNYYATPIVLYTFDILHAASTQTNADLYVSPNGSNMNSGLSWQEPLRNIWYALSIIQADSLNPHTIYLAPGTYSPSNNEEIYPLICNSYVSLQGSGENLTVLDAESTAQVLRLEGICDLAIEQMTITGGVANAGAGIYASNCEALIEHCTIRNNIAVGCAYNGGGGIFSGGAKLQVRYCTITDNVARHSSYSASGGGGAVCCQLDSSTFSYCTIKNNLADSLACGGAIFCSGYPVFRYCTITGNHSNNRGGVSHITAGGNPTFENCTMSGNSAPSAAGIDLYLESSTTIQTTIIEGCVGSAAVGCYGYDADAEIIYSDFCNNASGNFSGTNLLPGLGQITTINTNQDSCDQYYNIYLDPQFVDPQNGDYHLQENSPCIDAGDPASPYDPDYTVADIGAWYFDQSTPVAISLIPYNAPITIPAAGGSFQFDLEIHNDDTLAYAVDVYTTVTLPGGVPYPIYTRTNIQLSAGAAIIKDSLTQYVPASAAPGLYYYNAYIRDHYTWEILDQSSFPFEKLYGVDTPQHKRGWNLEGWAK